MAISEFEGRLSEAGELQIRRFCKVFIQKMLACLANWRAKERLMV